MNISIVIPVYNEADRLADCLEAIAAQTLTPYEVIVIDNNSSDDSAAVARRFSFVTLLTESRQGVVHARNLGFNTARGDIIGRIDADTILPPGWTAQIRDIFKDSSVSAVSGSPHYHDFLLSGITDAVDKMLRANIARKLGDENFLWGANMAVRQSAWQSVKHELCNQSNLHEDFDLAIHLQANGNKVTYDENLQASVSLRRIDTGLVSYVRYTLASPRTYAVHGLASRRHMYPVLMVCWLVYLPARLIYRGYNMETGTFSLFRLLSASDQRVDPTTNVI